MAKIYLNNSVFTVVDDDDLERLSSHKWHFDGFYAARRRWDRAKKVYVAERMHRVVMNTPKGMDTDHINGDKLDNRKCNLRVCTRSQNKVSGSLNRKDNKSGTKGVHYDKSRGKWMAFLRVHGKFRNLGRFNHKEDAIIARKEAELEYLNGEIR